jgi:hypothetical protein
MSAIINFVEPAELLFQAIEKRSPFANGELKPVRLARSANLNRDSGSWRKQSPLKSRRSNYSFLCCF